MHKHLLMTKVKLDIIHLNNFGGKKIKPSDRVLNKNLEKIEVYSMYIYPMQHVSKITYTIMYKLMGTKKVLLCLIF